MNYRTITEYVNKYGYEFVLEALEDAEDRENYKRANGARVIRRKQNEARVIKLAKEIGVRLNG